MPRVARLPEDLVNKIAAGEVVERPASVVKELVENALDAGARSIGVEIEAGGKALVRVRDDGCGMGREDAQLALERHATSKLRALSDLSALASHGFRGEALPSIASVAELTLRTREEDASAGTEVAVRFGKTLHVRDVGHPRGTTVEVRDLFGAVPARRKFLRADSTEAGHVAESLSLLALARPDAGFRLSSGGRTLIEATPADGLRARVYQLFGAEALEDLVPVDGGGEWVRVRGFVSRPGRPSPARATLRLFVNGRSVRDRAVSKAVLEAHRLAAGGDRRPEAILFLELPLEMVDVNVHPAKTEVRFADGRSVWRAVEQAVREALSEGARREAPRADTRGVAEAAERYLARADREPGDGTPAGGQGSPPPRDWTQAPPAAGAGPRAASLLEAAGPAVLGQHRNTYIVVSDGEDLLLLDQHTAHERARYEAILDRLARRDVEAQRLLTPLVVTLPPALRPVYEEHAETLGALGFEAEPFGGGALSLRSLPSLIAGRDAGAALQAILKDLVERDAADWAVAAARERLAATLACHSSVRGGSPLSPEAMGAIVRGLLATAHPALCPHGRPTSVRIPRDDISRWFGRTGWRRR